MKSHLFHYSYISREGRKHLHNYRYVGVDASVCSKFMQPFWEYVARRIPRTIAPNLITFIGFIGILVALGVFCVYYPSDMMDLESTVPTWVYWFVAFCFFYYQTIGMIKKNHF